MLVPSPASASRSLAAGPTVQRSRRTRDVDHRSGRGSAKRSATTANIQRQLVVGAAADPFEREAERTADAVTFGDRAPASVFDDAPLASSLLRVAQRATGKAEEPTKKDDDEKERQAQKAASTAGGPDVVPPGLEASIQSMSAGGQPLDAAIRSSFETRFGFDFSAVRVHTGTIASNAAMALSARAFTVGDHIFFGPGEYQPSSATGQRLIAHELTHTIQQKPGDARAARLLAAPRRVQRLFGDTKAAILSKVRGWISKDFPPWELITLIIGYDPIREVSVKGSTRDFIRAALKLVPDGEALFQKLDTEGRIDAVAKWWDAQIATLDLTYSKIAGLVKQAWDALGASDLIDPTGAYEKKIKPIFQPVVKRVWDFIKAVGAKILQVVRDLVLKSIGEWAQKQKGYSLLTMVLGRDPVTSEEVKPTLKGVIFAVLDLVPSGDKIKENLEKSKTVEKAAAWFQAEVKKLKLTWAAIKLLFAQAWDAFKVADLLNPRTLFEKMATIFGPPVSRLLAFLAAVGKKILEFIFEGAMLIAGPVGLQIVGIIRKVGDTFHRIIEDPVAFVGHLVNAVKKGIQQFAKNIWEHLKTGLINWLVGTLEGAGLVLPKVWDLRGILDLVLQVLGITYAKVRVKLVKATSEKTVSMLETGFAFVKTLVTEGPAAAWREIVGAIGSLWDMVIGGIKDWVVTKIVTAAITKLATMLNPAGAVIQAIIATYNTIAFFIERIKQILAFVEAVVDSIANIAMGKIAQAANWVETAMARTIPVILGFLARLIGLGDVSEAIKKVITAIQEKVDKAIDSVITWLVDKAKALFGKGDPKGDPKWDAAVAGIGAEVDAMPEEEKNEAAFTKRLATWKAQYGFTALLVTRDAGELVIEGTMSPGKKVKTVKDAATIVKELEGEEYIQVKRGSGWIVGKLDKIDKVATEIYYTVVFPKAGTVKAMAKFFKYGEVVRKYVRGSEAYLSPEQLTAANSKVMGPWDDFGTARKVLNYRANEDNDQTRNPPGKEWHHIHEQSGNGPHSVPNLALTSRANNAKFNTWFGQMQYAVQLGGDVGALEGTGALSLRSYLKQRSNPDLWRRWGYACLAIHKVSVQPGSPADKGPWNHIPGEA
jgi:hypothetical protein